MRRRTEYLRSPRSANGVVLEQEEFEASVARAEAAASAHPEFYRLKVGAFAALGYLVIFLLIGGVLALTGGSSGSPSSAPPRRSCC